MDDVVEAQGGKTQRSRWDILRQKVKDVIAPNTAPRFDYDPSYIKTQDRHGDPEMGLQMSIEYPEKSKLNPGFDDAVDKLLAYANSGNETTGWALRANDPHGPDYGKFREITLPDGSVFKVINTNDDSLGVKSVSLYTVNDERTADLKNAGKKDGNYYFTKQVVGGKTYRKLGINGSRREIPDAVAQVDRAVSIATTRVKIPA